MSKMKDELLRVAGVIDESIVDGPGIRFVIFTQGCPHDCLGCHNPQTHDFSGGESVHLSRLYEDIMENPLVSGVTLSGGEPFCQPEPLAELAQELKRHGKHIMAYTGYTWEQLRDKHDAAIECLLAQCDILVDGRFIESQKDMALRFRGSKNQRMIDVQKSLREDHVVLAEM